MVLKKKVKFWRKSTWFVTLFVISTPLTYLSTYIDPWDLPIISYWPVKAIESLIALKECGVIIQQWLGRTPCCFFHADVTIKQGRTMKRNWSSVTLCTNKTYKLYPHLQGRQPVASSINDPFIHFNYYPITLFFTSPHLTISSTNYFNSIIGMHKDALVIIFNISNQYFNFYNPCFCLPYHQLSNGYVK